MSEEAPFKPGEIAIIVRSNHGYVGQECEVIGGLTRRPGLLATGRISIAWGYVVRTSDGRRWITSHDSLKRRKPPQPREQLARWEDVPYWNPTRVTA